MKKQGTSMQEVLVSGCHMVICLPALWCPVMYVLLMTQADPRMPALHRQDAARFAHAASGLRLMVCVSVAPVVAHQ